MTRHIFRHLLLFFCLLAVQGESQALTLPCDSTIIFKDTLDFKYQLSKSHKGKQLANITESTAIEATDFDSIIVITRMQVSPSSNNDLGFTIDKKTALLYIPTEKGLYTARSLKPKQYNAGTKQRHGKIVEMMQALGNPTSCVFSIYFLYKDRYYYPAIGYVDGSQSIFIDEKLNRYTMIEDLIIGLYGSMEQYAQLHAEELYWRKVIKSGSKEEKDAAFKTLRHSCSNDTIYANKLLEINRMQD